jgi:hypothetical protein
MRRLFAFFSFLAAAGAIAFGAADDNGQWMMRYYKSPEPEAVAAKMAAWQKQGMLKEESTQPVMIGFFLRVMHDNPGKAVEWLQLSESYPPVDRQAIRIAAWYSKVPAAKDYLKSKALKEFADREPPDVALLPVDNPSSMDFNWAIYFASGDAMALRRIIGAFGFGMDYGAIERLPSSRQTAADRRAAANDATFRAAQWSITSNCQQDETIFATCKRLLKSGELSDIEQTALKQSLAKVKPDDPDLKAEDPKPKDSKPEK